VAHDLVVELGTDLVLRPDIVGDLPPLRSRRRPRLIPFLDIERRHRAPPALFTRVFERIVVGYDGDFGEDARRPFPAELPLENLVGNVLRGEEEDKDQRRGDGRDDPKSPPVIGFPVVVGAAHLLGLQLQI
jgi:hypothetical protein